MSHLLRSRRLLICASPLLATMLLAACQRDTLPIAKSSPEPARAVPAAGAAPAYVGRWAVTPTACRDNAWTLASNQLRSPGPFTCSFERVSPTLAGYTVAGMCQVGKASAPGRLVFTMSRLPSGLSLTVSGGPFQEPIGLVRCPEGVQAATEPADGQG